VDTVRPLPQQVLEPVPVLPELQRFTKIESQILHSNLLTNQGSPAKQPPNHQRVEQATLFASKLPARHRALQQQELLRLIQQKLTATQDEMLLWEELLLLVLELMAFMNTISTRPRKMLPLNHLLLPLLEQARPLTTVSVKHQ